MEKSYTKSEVTRLLSEAARSPERGEKLYSLDEVRVAAREAGIPAGRVEDAAAQIDRRRGLRIGLLVAVASSVLVVLVMIVWPPAGLGGWREGSLLVQNEHRRDTYVVELLVPVEAESDCRQPPPVRVAAEGYGTWRSVTLPPGARLQLDAPERPGRCPLVWVKTTVNGLVGPSAVFELPAGVEIERTGRLDQRGAGRPHMFLPPPLEPSPANGRSS
jgi:hypothetical protein